MKQNTGLKIAIIICAVILVVLSGTLAGFIAGSIYAEKQSEARLDDDEDDDEDDDDEDDEDKKDEKDRDDDRDADDKKVTEEAPAAEETFEAPAAEEEPKQAELNFAPAKTAFLKTLDNIWPAYYYYQFDYEATEYSNWPKGPNPIVAFHDMTGDGVPEMLTLSAEYGGKNPRATLYRANGDQSDSRIETALGEEGSTSYYCFFTVKSDSSLYLLQEMAGMVQLYRYTGDSFQSELISEGDRQAVYDDADKILLYNKYYEQLHDQPVKGELKGMTKGEAVRLLQVNEDPAPGQLPFDEPVELCFTSGAGAWGTYITMNPDGSFEGSYHDSNMGETGPGYPDGTVYCCNFSGRFENIEKVNDFTYKMTLNGYNNETGRDSEWIEDDIKYIPSEAYGIDGGRTFYLYLPGTREAQVPQGVYDWIFDLFYNHVGEITGFALYNEAQEQAFGSSN